MWLQPEDTQYVVNVAIGFTLSSLPALPNKDTAINVQYAVP